MKNTPARPGFTFIDICAIGTIFAFIFAFFSPLSQKTRSNAQRKICENNMRQQVIFQLNYATDNRDNFAPRTYVEPWYVRDAFIYPPYVLRTHELYKPYFGQASRKVLICPFIKKFAQDDKNYWGLCADTSWYNPMTDWGGWDALNKTGGLPRYVVSPFNWFMGFKPMNIDQAITFSNGETPWALNKTQCTSTNAASSHVLNSSAYHTTTKWRDLTHCGSVLFWAANPERVTRTGTTPTAYSDGHVEYHDFDPNSANPVRVRASYKGKSYTDVLVAY
jgi:hypothetical protein